MNFEATQRVLEDSDILGHLPFLYAEALKCKVVVELGVRTGVSTVAFLSALEKNGGHLWSVDIEPPTVRQEWYENPLWTFLLGNDLDVFDQLPKEIGLLLIDTNHQYAQTLSELELYAPRSKTVLCHDMEEVAVARAVTEYCHRHGLHLHIRAGSYGLGVIRKK